MQLQAAHAGGGSLLRGAGAGEEGQLPLRQQSRPWLRHLSIQQPGLLQLCRVQAAVWERQSRLCHPEFCTFFWQI